MKDSPLATRTLRLTGCALAGALFFAGAPAFAQAFPEDGQWIPLSRGGAPLIDGAWDSGGYPDLVGGKGAPAAFVYLDAQAMYFRLRVNKTALISPPAEYQPFAWTCLLDIDAEASGYELSVGLDGRADPSAVELWRNLAQASPDDPGDESELLLASYPAVLQAREVLADSALGEGPDHFVDWAVPRADLLLAAPFAGPVRFACGSSLQASGLAGDLLGQSALRQLPGLWSDYLVCDDQSCWESPCLGAGEPCWSGVGACAAIGVNVCDESGQTVCNAIAGQPTTEICDGQDNDCDGLVDEELGLGAACSAGVGACRAQGVLACTPDGAVKCDALLGVPSEEICDGIDNDCDGVIDDGLDVGASCTVGLGGCAVTGTVVCGATGRAVCSAVPADPAPEQCDGKDNDCGGEADETFRVGHPCSVGVGACAAIGVVACTLSGVAACAAVPGEPSAEVCDGIDNDCDGVVDDGYGIGESCSAGVGACLRGGEIACLSVDASGCNAQPGQPVTEICDGIDNDCDGEIDNGLDVGAPCGVGLGACFAIGVIECGADGVPVCGAKEGQPSAETCDGIDNDCNGVADDGLHLGSTCGAGVGACRVDGKMVCSKSGAAVCDAVPGQAAAEKCGDGVDNDCDGETDEGCSTMPKGCQVDSDCGSLHSGMVCDVDIHACKAGCRAIGNGCPMGEICTSQSLDIGECQSAAGCQSDHECASAGGGMICDMGSGECIVGCRSDAGCGAPLTGMICDAATRSCVMGCGSDADCGAPSSGRVCDAASRRCVDGCHADADCGGAGSGRICDAASKTCAHGCRDDQGCSETQICVVASGDAGVCSFEVAPVPSVDLPSCAVPKGDGSSRDWTAYLLLAMASLALSRRRS